MLSYNFISGTNVRVDIKVVSDVAAYARTLVPDMKL